MAFSERGWGLMFVQLCDYLHPVFSNFLKGKKIKSIFQLGCYDGSDTLLLRDAFCSPVVAFECNPDILPEARIALAGQANITLVEAAVWDTAGMIPFHPVVSTSINGRESCNNRSASSCFRARHDYRQVLTQRDVLVPAIRLDTYCCQQGIESIDLLCLDVQGAALRALRSLGEMIDAVQYIISEIEVRPIYYGEDLFPNVHLYLSKRRFRLAAEVCRDDWFSDFLYTRHP